MILEATDRGITELLRMAVVKKGFLPDVTLYPDADAWMAAKNVLQNSLVDKTLIEVFGVGTAQSRQEKTACKITVDRRALVPVTEGVFTNAIIYQWDKELKKFRKYKGFGAYYDIDYEIRTVSNTTKFDRITAQIILSTIPHKMFVQYFGDGFTKDDVFLLEFLGSNDLLPDEQWLERLYRYRARRIPLDEVTEIGEVPPLLEVKVDVIPVPRITDFEDTELLEELYEDLPKGTVYVPPTDDKW